MLNIYTLRDNIEQKVFCVFETSRLFYENEKVKDPVDSVEYCEQYREYVGSHNVQRVLNLVQPLLKSEILHGNKMNMEPNVAAIRFSLLRTLAL